MTTEQAQNKTVEILVHWAGIKKNGKYAVMAKGPNDTNIWYNLGKDFKERAPEFIKDKKYSVIVGVDQFGNNYINGLTGDDPEDEGGDFPEELKTAESKATDVFKGSTATHIPPKPAQNSPISQKSQGNGYSITNRQSALNSACSLLREPGVNVDAVLAIAKEFLKFLEE